MVAMTELQRQVLGAVVVVAAEKVRVGVRSDVTTLEVARRLGRVSQPIGNSLSSLERHGLVKRVDDARYRMTDRGLQAVVDALGRAI